MDFQDLAFDDIVFLSVDPDLDGKARLRLSNFIGRNFDLDSHRFDGSNFKKRLSRFNGGSF